MKKNIDKPTKEHKQVKVPIQKRAERTVKLILDTSAELIKQVGLEGFNTNLLAARAGINIATIYRYFPNKNKIIVALYEKWKQNVQVIIDEITDLENPLSDWRDIFDRAVNRYLTMAHGERNFIALRNAMQASPELKKIENRTNKMHAESFAKLLRERGLEVPEKQLQAITLSFIEIVAKIVDLALIDDSDSADELNEELTLIYQSYLANYLD